MCYVFRTESGSRGAANVTPALQTYSHATAVAARLAGVNHATAVPALGTGNNHATALAR
jgi:hypothetical protein